MAAPSLVQRSLVATILAGMLIGACSDEESDGSAATSIGPTQVRELDCDRLGYPCNWRDADPEVLDLSLQLLGEVADGLENGQSPEALANLLEDVDQVVAINWADEGVIFRLEGGLPVSAFTEAASPTEYTLASASNIGVTAPNSQSSQLGLAPTSGPSLARTTFQQDDSPTSYQPTRHPGIRPRQVLVLSPTRSADLAAAQTAAEKIGASVPAAAPTLTRDTFTASEYFEVLDLADESAHPGYWASMGSYDVVVIETHGANYEAKPEREVDGLFLAGPPGESYLANTGLSEEEALFKDLGGISFARLSTTKTFHLMFSDDFFYMLPGEGVGDSIIILNACRMGEENVSVTALASTIAGTRGSVFSWDTAVPRDSADATTAVLAELLVDGATASAAMTQLRFDQNDTAEYKDVTAQLLLYQEPGLSMRARDTVTTFVDGSVAKNGVTIAAKGVPDDGDPDRIEGATIRIDAVNRGDEDTTIVKITVDGEPLKVIRNGAEVEDVVLDEDTVREGAEPKGSWRHHEIDLDQAILPFDLTKEDVTQGQGHVWEVTVEGEEGEPSIHKVDPVVFRLGTVKISNPNTGFPLASNDKVSLDGTLDDGQSEIYPLIIRVEHLDESANPDEFRVELTFDGEEEIWPLNQFERRSDGTYVLEDDRDIGDLQEEETPISLSAVLIRTPASGGGDIEMDQVDASPVIVVVDDESGLGSATIVVGGQSWHFQLTEFEGSSCHLTETSLLVAGAVNGDQFDVTFSALIHVDGTGEISVMNPHGDEDWYAGADREHITNLHLVPDGQSQIDSVEFEGKLITGTATFIDGEAVRLALLEKSPLPPPFPGSFTIQCP